MSKYSLIHELCESRIFRSKQAMDKYDTAKGSELLYAVLLSTIALALHPKTHNWAKGYAAKSSAFGNFDFFRPTATDLYVLTHMAQERGVIGLPGARSLLRLYKELSKGNVDSNFAEQTLLRMERALRVGDARLRNARRALTHWSQTSGEDQKATIENLYRIVRLKAKLAEVLPYLQAATSREPGHFGKTGLGAYAAAIGGAALAGVALGYHYDTGKRWGILRNSAEFDGEKLLKEDRPTQLFIFVQNLNKHPDVEKIISVRYLTDGISAFVRATDGNAYELEIRPAPFARGHEEKRGVTESEEEPKCQWCNDTGYETVTEYDDTVKVPCDQCDAERTNEGCWEWEIKNVIMERNDAAKVGNDAAVIVRSAKQAADGFEGADKGHQMRTDDVGHLLAHIRDMYGVEIVDDFVDVLELPNSEDDTDKQPSLFSKDNR